MEQPKQPASGQPATSGSKKKRYTISCRRPWNRSSRLTWPSGPSNAYSFSTAIHGIRRRSAASASRARVSSFSFTSSSSRAACHSWGETIVGVFMVSSFVAVAGLVSWRRAAPATAPRSRGPTEAAAPRPAPPRRARSRSLRRRRGKDPRLESLEALGPPVLVLVPRPGAGQTGLGEDDRRPSTVLLELDRHRARDAVGLVALPVEGEDDALRGSDLEVGALERVHRVAARLRHRNADAAAGSQVDLDGRGSPVPPGGQPPAHHLGAGPRLEHVLARGVERPSHLQLELVHPPFRSSRYCSTTSNLRSQRRRWRSIHPEASSSESALRLSRCSRPSTTRTITSASSSTRRCLLIAGFDTPVPAAAWPTVAGPRASRSTIRLRTGCDSAANE